MLDYYLQNSRCLSSDSKNSYTIDFSHQGTSCLIHQAHAVGDVESIKSLIARLLDEGETLSAVLRAIFSESEHLSDAHIFLCRFESFHYELAWRGDFFAYLHSASSGELSELIGGQSGFEGSMLGDLHSGETLMVSEQSISFGSEALVIECLFDPLFNAERVARGLCDQQGSSSHGAIGVFRYTESEQAFSKKDFNHRSPIDRSRYTDNVNSRPLFLFLVLLSILVILLVI